MADKKLRISYTRKLTIEQQKHH